MAEHVCPWWAGYLLASPIRRLVQDPAKTLAPYVREGMTVVEVGPGMGFFTIELARRVGDSGRVVVVDIQSKMLEGLKRRVARAGLLERVHVRLVEPDSMGLADLSGAVDLVVAIAVVHEMPSASTFFSEAFQALKPGGGVLLSEPSGHVNAAKFDFELGIAAQAGLNALDRPSIRHCHSALLKKN
jgi:ubiquinone/menaquinone biosynthesis C-methylase UbiE